MEFRRIMPSLFLLSWLGGHDVYADDRSADSTALERAGRVIEEVIVTAQKSKQSLKDVPVAVSVVGGDTLRDAGVFGAEGIENLVPNVELDGDAQSPTIGIRGFSTDSYTVGIEPSVGIIVDDVSLGRTEFIPDGLYDIQRVEVLRGPQGTLFGKNTIAGVLIFGTGEPGPDPTGSILTSLGENDERRVEVAANAPLSDTLLSRISGLFWKNGGEIDNSFLNRKELAYDQYAARVKLSYDVTDQLQLRLGGQFADIQTDYSAWQLYDVDADALAYARSKDPATEDDPFNQQTSFDLPGFVDHSTNLIHLAADYELNENHKLTAILGHANLENNIGMDFDVSAADLVRVLAHHDYSQDSLELRLNGQLNLFGVDGEYVGGVFAFQSDMYFTTDVSAGGDLLDFALTPAGLKALGAPDLGPLSPLLGPLLVGLPVPQLDPMDGVFQQFSQDSESLAAFGQITWFLSDRLSLITGLRIGREEKNGVLDIQSRGLGIAALLLGADEPPNTNFSKPLKRRESEVSPKLGLSYEFNNALTLYGSWTRGFKGGGFNANSFNSKNLEFEPEQGDSFELGAKTRLFDNSMSLNATLYYTKISNMQVMSFSGVGFDVFNAAESLLKGFEMDMAWLTPLEWLSINAALSVSSARYESYTQGPQTQAQAADCNANCAQDLSGKTLPKAPQLTASISPEVTLPLNDWLGMALAADISHRGDQYLTLDLDPHAYQGAQTLVGARVSLGALDESWGVSLRGANLTDEEALSFVADHNLYANSYFATQIPGRSLSLNLHYQW